MWGAGGRAGQCDPSRMANVIHCREGHTRFHQSPRRPQAAALDILPKVPQAQNELVCRMRWMWVSGDPRPVWSDMAARSAGSGLLAGSGALERGPRLLLESQSRNPFSEIYARVLRLHCARSRSVQMSKIKRVCLACLLAQTGPDPGFIAGPKATIHT